MNQKGQYPVPINAPYGTGPLPGSQTPLRARDVWRGAFLHLTPLSGIESSNHFNEAS